MATINQSTLPLFERVALVTGGAERVGREIAFTLAEQGCDIIIHYNRSAEEAEELANELRTLGRQAWTLQGDFSTPDDAEIVLRSAWEVAGWVDIVINNAAIFEL
ncbi:MAG: SDR family NAD(P)-dependent oxidoreductase, partial [Kiritimatiellae bacterium]|nr:SDR family NAD(P)-dependent oxidoreductase [Kiritimatiellia bacterium]